jgi:hypothetical protein
MSTVPAPSPESIAGAARRLEDLAERLAESIRRNDFPGADLPQAVKFRERLRDLASETYCAHVLSTDLHA